MLIVYNNGFHYGIFMHVIRSYSPPVPLLIHSHCCWSVDHSSSQLPSLLRSVCPKSPWVVCCDVSDSLFTGACMYTLSATPLKIFNSLLDQLYQHSLKLSFHIFNFFWIFKNIPCFREISSFSGYSLQGFKFNIYNIFLCWIVCPHAQVLLWAVCTQA